MDSVPAKRKRRGALVALDDETILAHLYSRVSSQEQAEGASLTAQGDEGRRYIGQHAAQRWIYEREFQDVESGRRDDRAAYQALLMAVRGAALAGQRVVVVVAAFDRLGRNVRERVRAWEELAELGVVIHSVREGGVVTEFTYNILAAVAQEESRQIGVRVRKSLDQYERLGWHKPGSAPWGYRWRPATPAEKAEQAPASVLKLDPDTAPYVREAWDRRLRGDSFRSIARWVADLPSHAKQIADPPTPAKRGDRPRKSTRSLGPTAIVHLFRSPVYVGRMGGIVDGDEDGLSRPLGRWVALVTDEEWRRCHQLRELDATMARQASGDFALTGRLWCPSCGSRMHGRTATKTGARGDIQQRQTYVCSSEWMGQESARATCWTVIPARAIERPVLTSLRGLLSAVEQVAGRDQVEQVVRAGATLTLGPDPTAQITRIDRELERIRMLIGEASVKRIAGEIDDEAYLAGRAHLNAEKLRLTAEKLRLEERAPAAIGLAAIDAIIAGLAGWRAALEEADAPALREALAVLIKKITPERIGHGTYRAHVAYTEIGLALLEVAAGTGAPVVRVVQSDQPEWSTRTLIDRYTVGADGTIDVAASA